LAVTRTKSPKDKASTKRPAAAPSQRKTRRPAAPSKNGDGHEADESADEAAEAAAQVESNGHAPAAPKRRATAQSMAAKQRDISVSEFFAKNRHLLGFDNPRKALLTTVKEAVDNSLDACEEAGILPEIWVHIESTGNDRYKVAVQDNGPGIVKKQIPLIFGRSPPTNRPITTRFRSTPKRTSRRFSMAAAKASIFLMARGSKRP
jgi:DNA topoisomerase-6 subunit B